MESSVSARARFWPTERMCWSTSMTVTWGAESADLEGGVWRRRKVRVRGLRESEERRGRLEGGSVTWTWERGLVVRGRLMRRIVMGVGSILVNGSVLLG